jgi:hypothetical protein
MLFAECWMQEYCAIICAWMAEYSKMIHLQMIKQPQVCGCDAQTASLENGNSLSWQFSDHWLSFQTMIQVTEGDQIK